MADIQADLGLDTSEALDSIDSIGTALDQITAQFKVGLADAVGVLDGVSVEVDASAVTTEIDSAVAAADTSVDVEAAVTGTEVITAEIDAAVAGADATVEIDADTTSATQAVTELGDSAANATPATDGLGESMGGLSESASGAGEAVTGMTAGLLGGNAAIAGATAGVAAYVAALGSFFETGVKSKGAIERLNVTLGEFAKNVEHIKVGDLNTSLGDLAEQTGSSGAGMRQAAASASQLQIAAGQSQETASLFSAQLLALSGRAVALNPNLGETGDVAAAMGKALARGGRFAASFGVSLTATEIKARAAKDAQAGLSDGVSQAALQMAGAEIAVEKYGNSLKGTLAEGAKSPELQLRALQKQVASTVAEVSRPLVSPMLDLLQAAVPMLQGFARVLGSSFQALVPALTPIFAAISKVVTVISGPLERAFVEIGPALTHLGEAVGTVIEALLPLEPVVSTVVELFASGLSTAINIVATVLETLAPLVPFVAAGFVLFQAAVAGAAFAVGGFSVAIAALGGPITVAVGALALLGAAISLFSDDEPVIDMTKSVEALGPVLDAQATSAVAAANAGNDLTESTKKASDAFADYINKSSGFAQLGVANELVDASISMDKVKAATEGGADALAKFDQAAAGAAASGAISVEEFINMEKAVRAEQVAFREASQAKLDDLVATGQITAAQEKEILARNKGKIAVDAKTAADVKQDLAQIKALESAGVLTKAQADKAEADLKAAGSTTDYAAALDQAALAADRTKAKQDFLKASQDQAQTAAAASAQTYVFLAETIASTPLTADTQIADFATKLGLLPDQVKPVTDAVSAAIKGMADTFVQQLPKASDAFSEMQNNLDGSFDLQGFISKLQTQAFAIAAFPSTIKSLTAQGFNDLAAFIGEQGATASAGLIAALQKAGPDGAKALDDALRLVRENGAVSAQQLTELATPLANALGISIEAAKQALGTQASAAGVQVGTDLGAGVGTGAVPATEQSLGQVQTTLDGHQVPLSQSGAALGQSTTDGYSGSLDFLNPTDAAVEAARRGYGAGQSTVAGAAAKVGSGAKDSYADGLKLGDASNLALNAASTIIQQNSLVKAVALSAGYQVGQSFTAGIKAGVLSLAGEVATAAAKVVNDAEKAARKAADSNSPSLLFAALGEDIAAGVALGISESTLPVSASTAMVSDIAGTVAGANVGAVNTTNGGDQVTIAVTVNAVPGMSESEAQQQGRTIGVAAARAWVSEVAAQ